MSSPNLPGKLIIVFCCRFVSSIEYAFEWFWKRNPLIFKIIVKCVEGCHDMGKPIESFDRIDGWNCEARQKKRSASNN